MAKWRGVEEALWAFSLVTGILYIGDLLSKPRMAQAAKQRDEARELQLRLISKKLAEIDAKLGR